MRTPRRQPVSGTLSRGAGGLLASILMLAMGGCCDQAILTNQLPQGQVGGSYFASLRAECDVGQWFLISGTLPPGVGFNEDGVISGVPSRAGIFTFTVGVTKTGSVAPSDVNVSKGFEIVVVE